jgi:primosomal protein N' (replication factor Y) (superfamily II helicase)
MFADIIFPSIKDKSYTYIIEGDTPRIGARVIVPLGNRKETGFVIDIKDKCEHKNLKSIIEIIDEDEVLTPDLWELSKWMSNYYYADWGDTLRAFFPKETKISYKKTITLNVNSLDKALSLINVKTEGKLKILQEIFLKKKIDFNVIKKKTGVKNINTVLNEFVELGIATIETTSQGAKKKFEKTINLTPEFSDKNKLEEIISELPEKQADQLLRIASQSVYGKRPIKFLKAVKEKTITNVVVNSLIKKNIVFIGQEEVIRSETGTFPISNKEIILNNHQQIAVDEINKGIESNEYNPFFLYGITGSGKTQVYIETIKHALDNGKTAIVLVPEISLTPQLVQRFRNHFNDIVTVIHSKMSIGERYDSWRLIVEGKYKIVIGARSAIFAPLKNLGVIIVDEEHEPSYKQFDMNPRYNGRDTAVMRAIYAKAVIVLGSATPSIESFYNAKSGKFKLLELPERADGATLPEIEIITLKPGTNKGSDSNSISNELKDKITEKLKLNQKVILLQNHRGFSTVARCFNCGYVEVCENCNVTLTYHRTKHHLRCHYCGFVKPINDLCPQCHQPEKEFSGVGTQKVEEELHKLFPSAKLIRMDMDTTSKKGAHAKILKDFGEGKAEILLGTQMVAKGLDFSDVTLVGVVLADTSMHFPDFRANERTFQLLTQVAGRAGRSSLKGEVIIQTYQPNHKCFEFVKTQNFKDYYDYEISERSILLYPPFGRLILIEFKGADENEVAKSAEKFAGLLNDRYKIKLKSIGYEFCKIMGPTPAIISKVNNQFRYHIVIKMFREVDPSFKISRSVLDSAKDIFDKSHLSNKIKYTIDVDPQGLM